MSRAVKEWIGTHDDQAIPPRVKDRIFQRDGGKCHICKLPIKVGETWDADHITALANGGRHAESNLAPAHKHCHVAKSAIDVKTKAKIARVRQRHTGITKPAGKLRGAGFAKADKPRTGVDKSGLPPLPPRALYAKETT